MRLDTRGGETWVIETWNKEIAREKCDKDEDCFGICKQNPKITACSQLIIKTVNPETSTSFKNLGSDKFNYIRQDQIVSEASLAIGDYFSDTLQLGGVSVKNPTIGLAKKSTDWTGGMLGVGYS